MMVWCSQSKKVVMLVAVVLNGLLLVANILYTIQRTTAAKVYIPGTVEVLSHRSSFSDRAFNSYYNNTYGVAANRAAQNEAKVDTSWQVKRQSLLSSKPHLHKVYLFAYMRGGSTLLGQLFNQESDCMYWYEALNMFYGAYFGMPRPRDTYDIIYQDDVTLRDTEEWESKQLVEYFRSIYECRLQDLPPDAMGSVFLEIGKNSWMSSYVNCYKKQFTMDAHVRASWSRNMTGMSKVPTAPYSNLNVREYGQNCPDTSGTSVFCGKGRDPVTKSVKRALNAKCPEYIKLTNQWYANKSLNYNDLQQMFKEKNIMIDSERLNKFLSNADCVKKKRDRVNGCLKKSSILEGCTKSNIRAVKILRVKMRNFESLIREIPDMHVIHFVRDPRSIVHSKNNMFKCEPKDMCLVENVPRYCQEISEDIEIREQLEKKYPGAFLQVKYEDLILHQKDTITAMFNHIGRNASHHTVSWLQATTHAKSSGGYFSVQRQNGSALTQSWKDKYSATALSTINAHSVCKQLFQKLGYPLS